MLHRPAHQATNRLEQGRAQVGELILHLRWHDRVDGPLHEAVALELTESEGQHALTDAFDLSPKLGETTSALVEHGDHEDRPLVSTRFSI